MFRAMALKELRETRGIMLLALAAYSLLVMGVVSGWRVWSDRMPPFVDDSSFYSWFCFISGAMAIAVGLRQTIGESLPGTYPFLLHRPAGRRWLIGVKLAVGTGLCLVCAAVPILAYGIWAATPGTHPTPFEWSMTMPAWTVWFGFTLLYLGAFLAGIRPGRWYRSRILPLAAAGLVLFVVEVGAFALCLNESLWPCLAIFAFDAWMIAVILFVVRTRDYP
jgi:hypothetical protein